MVVERRGTDALIDVLDHLIGHGVVVHTVSEDHVQPERMKTEDVSPPAIDAMPSDFAAVAARAPAERSREPDRTSREDARGGGAERGDGASSGAPTSRTQSVRAAGRPEHTPHPEPRRRKR